MLDLKLDKIHLRIGIREDKTSVLMAICSPKALNAVPKECVQLLLNHLTSITKPVVLAGVGRSFCAGGDLKSALADRQIRAYTEAMECLVMRQLREMESYVVMSGVTMGFGAGMAFAAQVRVATDTTKLAFPENGIGLVPDVGASYWLSRLKPRELGVYLALTGTSLNGADCYYSGLAQYYVPIQKLDHLSGLQTQSPASFFSANHIIPPRSSCRVLTSLPAIQHHFSKSSLQSVIHSLENDSSPWAVSTLKTLRKACPLSLAVCWELVNSGSRKSFLECICSEYDAVVQLSEVHPYNLEVGITALLSGQEPVWRPRTLEELDDSFIQAILRNLEGQKLRL